MVRDFPRNLGDKHGKSVGAGKARHAMSRLFEVLEELPQPQKSNEWYTPSKYIEAAREVMGSIDLDPASCELANKTVKATKYYTKEEDGLSKEWHGRVWLNPPYGKINPIPGSTKSYQRIFVEKLLREYTAGRTSQAVLLLLGNSCFAHYFYPLWEYPLCFHDGFISFYRPDGSTSDFGFGTIFVYLGPNETKFTEAFSQFGRIVKAVDTPKRILAQQPTLF
jgi:DNA N-6-adenine-methyltransferase (Dam)